MIEPMRNIEELLEERVRGKRIQTAAELAHLQSVLRGVARHFPTEWDELLAEGPFDAPATDDADHAVAFVLGVTCDPDEVKP